ncbi:alkaline phosphatase PhoX [Pseudobacteriovorax antillogorgiicola]|uniref:Phosphatase n=1 Tax=Pseudobacteriovorax antillogorgiicola TaxID=1513793 RepID=A0A1Y6BS42_9BACT|nr:alkaline phosphatase PhoX [Pseudobacteriovorax antillogorgiicola]TCS53150.1 hypothetical protein EDD56_108201 [Pseudobacteriovorax antillogorgiicola]SMF25170.1 hypothetical protein SAMN06296036_10845 [Pseudobacteriovorax antillogorgiicola]
MTQFDRRRMLAGSFGVATASCFQSITVWAKTKPQGQLLKDKDKILDLPKGFSYKVLDKSGQKMDDGYVSPGRPDGMGCFQLGDDLVLLRNHEMSPSHRDPRPYPTSKDAPKEAYDANGFGGVTRLVLDAKAKTTKSRNLVLTGTHINCAGGVSPWGWLSCEETVAENHGYVFLCDPKANKVQKAQAIKNYGRMNHEAVCIDPADHTAYLSEDRGDSCFYRFVPKDKAKPFGDGRFQAMMVQGEPKKHLSSSKAKVGKTWSVTWIDIPNQDSPHDDLRHRSQAQGAAVVSRGEGLWYADGEVYLVSTDGGPTKTGQIFRYNIAKQTLTLIAQSENPAALDSPDNITVSPSGLVVVAEDGGRTPHLRIIGKEGQIYDLAKNAAGYGEFTGVCFSPDGKTLFANLQVQGLTVAIEGPFESYLKTAEANPNQLS